MYRLAVKSFFFTLLTVVLFSCKNEKKQDDMRPLASDILGNRNYKAIAYGSFRTLSRDTLPSLLELKEDLLILQAMNIKVLRTYHSQVFLDTERLLKAIKQLKEERNDFEMQLMLGVWIECANAWTEEAEHERGNTKQNQLELEAAIELANMYPDIIKIIAVGNEAMVHWAPYHVNPRIILNGVRKLKKAQIKGELPSHLWITSSDNYASWGGKAEYRRPELDSLINEVDFISIHTYPFHDTHYNADFWPIKNDSSALDLDFIEHAIDTAAKYAISQFNLVADYIKTKDAKKSIHLGETGWASLDGHLYGINGSKAADEYKQALYYSKINDWCTENQISCFYFEAFDEPWKSEEEMGSENHFGLITVDGEVKYALWDLVDQGAFNRLKRNGFELRKSYNGSKELLTQDILH